MLASSVKVNYESSSFLLLWEDKMIMEEFLIDLFSVTHHGIHFV